MRKIPLWLEAFYRSWPILIAVGTLVATAITRDISQENRLDEMDKYGTMRNSLDIAAQTKLNTELVQAVALMNQEMKDHARRIENLEKK